MDNRCRSRIGGREYTQRLIGPGGGLLLEIEVEILPCVDARTTERFEARVELATGLAEVDVSGIAEREDGETHTIEARRVIGHQCFVEVDRALRRVALAPGRDEHDEVL